MLAADQTLPSQRGFSSNLPPCCCHQLPCLQIGTVHQQFVSSKGDNEERHLLPERKLGRLTCCCQRWLAESTRKYHGQTQPTTSAALRHGTCCPLRDTALHSERVHVMVCMHDSCGELVLLPIKLNVEEALLRKAPKVAGSEPYSWDAGAATRRRRLLTAP